MKLDLAYKKNLQKKKKSTTKQKALHMSSLEWRGFVCVVLWKVSVNTG